MAYLSVFVCFFFLVLDLLLFVGLGHLCVVFFIFLGFGVSLNLAGFFLFCELVCGLFV